MTASNAQEARRGLLYAGGAFTFWGLAPLYWKLLGTVSAMELLAHRLIWSLPLLWLLIFIRGSFADFTQAIRNPKTRWTLLITTVLIGANWFLFIWAIAVERVLEASLGYFITPLFSVLLGFFVLGERPRRAQWAAIGLAGFGVTILVIHLGHLPWVALLLALTFGLYGLLRKTVAAGPIAGLTFEVSILAPLAAFFLVRHLVAGDLAFLHQGSATDLLLLAAGPVTVVPLVWFTNGARRLSLATLGLLQYLAPSGQFLLAVWVFGEPFSPTHLVAFGLIWCALALYTGEALAENRRQAKLRPNAAT
ncbi:MAG: EamA family transporter RarD [Thermoanaerobaculia bacterium]|nr:EamA family transporter RarD [Thermoanaerobaculia bacterium]